MVLIREIQRPSENVLKMLRHRMRPDAAKLLDECTPGAVGLFEAKLPELYYLADQAVKTAQVTAAEINGTCPQHVATMALFGDMEAVHMALKKIEQLTK